MYSEAFCCLGNWWLFSPMIIFVKKVKYILLWQNDNFLGKDISYFIKTDVRRWACQGKQCPPGGWRWGQEWSQLLTGNTASVRCLNSIRFERWTMIFSVNLDNIWEVLKVLESGSGEDLAVFCRSVISYCGKKGVEVKETIIRHKKIRQKWSGKNTQNCLCLTVDKRSSSQSEESVQLSGRKLGL